MAENRERLHYYSKDGTEVKPGDYIRFDGNSQIYKVYEWEDDDYIGLGTDATNPNWINDGRAFPTEYGIYPLNNNDKFEILCNAKDISQYKGGK